MADTKQTTPNTKTLAKTLALAVTILALATLAALATPTRVSAASSYTNLNAAVEYANKYWSYYNPNYRNQNPDGGDCANYVSQCLEAGGFTRDSSWYPYSSAWSYVPTQVSYFQNAWGKKLIANPQAGDIQVGDLVYYDWYGSGTYGHVTICVAIEGGVPVVNSHNNDRYHVKWNYGYSTTRYAVLKMTSGGSTPPSINISVSASKTTGSTNDKFDFYASTNIAASYVTLTFNGNSTVYYMNSSDKYNWSLKGNTLNAGYRTITITAYDSNGRSSAKTLNVTVNPEKNPYAYATPTRNLYWTSPMQKGDDVRYLQWGLQYLGFNCGGVDGLFGGMTHSALVAFQKTYGLSPDGIFGPISLAKMKSLIG